MGPSTLASAGKTLARRSFLLEARTTQCTWVRVKVKTGPGQVIMPVIITCRDTDSETTGIKNLNSWIFYIQGRAVVRSTAQYSRPRTLRSTCVVLRRYCGYKYINFYYLRWWGARAARSERWFARCRGAVESEGTRVVASILVATAALRTRRSDFFLVHFFCRLAAGTSLRRHGRFVVVEFQVFVRVSKQVLLFLHVVVNI